MKNELLYNKTVDILVQAYFNDTLQHGNCAACAIGNLVAAGMGISLMAGQNSVWKGYGFPAWTSLFSFGRIHNQGALKNDMVIKEIEVTGYTIDEAVKIEGAFENCSKNGDYMFNGLMAVIDVLDEIHENNDTETTKSTKQKFQKQLAW